ncbi:hypothetical protein I79_026074 [Cricetulus griseus]|uniref:Uncharacterized protein n=1 Tax=Cricetulus griseus TaxID=10029 RepID=G3IPY9_CRIGR|nr:hypothetical protein I79_026074 [Cricetulus griseus]
MPSDRRGALLPLFAGTTLYSPLYSVSTRGADCHVSATLVEVPHCVAQASLELSVWFTLV